MGSIAGFAVEFRCANEKPHPSKRSCEETSRTSWFLWRARDFVVLACAALVDSVFSWRCGFLNLACGCRGQRFSQADPLLQVVGKVGPEHLHLHFAQPANVKLAQTELAFDPGMAKFHDSATPTIASPCFCGFHLLPESQTSGALLPTQNPPAAAILRTALWLAGTASTILRLRQIAAGKESALLLQASLVAQELALGTHIAIRLGLKNESARGQPVGSGPPRGRVFSRHAPQKIYLSFRHLLDGRACGVTRVGHHLLRLALQPFCDAFHRGKQLARVVGVLCYLHTHNQPLGRIRGNLRVVAQRPSSIGRMHHPRLRIAAAHSYFALSLFSVLAVLQLLPLLPGFSQPLLLLAPASLARLLGSGVALFVPWITHLRHASPGPLQMLANRLLLLITPADGLGLKLRAVLHHLFQRDQSFLAQRRQHLGEQFIQLLLLLHTKIRQRVVVHFLQSRQPLESRIKLAPSRHFPRRSHPLAVGVDPQTDQQLRIECRTPAFFGTALDGLIKGPQVQPPHQRPNSSRRMVFADEAFHIHGSPAHLLPVHVANQRVFAYRIFLAHAASLR